MASLETRLQRLESQVESHDATKHDGWGIAYVWENAQGETLAELPDKSRIRLPDNWRNSDSVHPSVGATTKILVGVNPDWLRGEAHS